MIHFIHIICSIVLILIKPLEIIYVKTIPSVVLPVVLPSLVS